jgi:hypothetical protein
MYTENGSRETEKNFLEKSQRGHNLKSVSKGSGQSSWDESRRDNREKGPGFSPPPAHRRWLAAVFCPTGPQMHFVFFQVVLGFELGVLCLLPLKQLHQLQNQFLAEYVFV